MLSLRRKLLSTALILSFAPAFLAPQALLAQKTTTTKTPAKAAAKPAAAAASTAAVSPSGAKIDINTATADQLKAFPGIGDAYSKRIIDNRPYSNKAQLVSKGALPKGVYEKLKEKIIATQPK